MATIYPFCALRPTNDKGADVAALPYDVLSAAEARVIGNQNKVSFLHVDKPEIDLPDDTPAYAPQIYAQARKAFWALVLDGVLKSDPTPSFYVYRQTVDGRSQIGLAACADVREYDSGTIKKHELTRTDKEKDRVDHVDAVDAHTGPIFLTYRAKPEPKEILAAWIAAHKPIYDFVSEDGVSHTMWCIDDLAVIDQLTQTFKNIDALYIADGHHRAAAASIVASQRRGPKDNAESNRFLSVIFPHDELVILDYNRLVRDLNGQDTAKFLAAVGEKFKTEEQSAPVKPTEPMQFGLYTAGKWYKLTYKADPPKDVVERLAVSVLQSQLLSPILGIADPKTDKRIDFVGGIRGTAELEKRVNSKEMAAAFTLCPTSLTDLMDVSDAGRIMPPKSTWFEPKLRSGLLIHRF